MRKATRHWPTTGIRLARCWVWSFPVLACGALAPAPAAAQLGCLVGRCITVGSSTAIIPAATATDFNAGHTAGTVGTTYTVATGLLSTQSQVLVRSMSASLGVYGKPIGDLQWRRADLSTWNDMTTTNAQVQTGTGEFSNTVYYRVRLRWTDDVPGTYGATIRYTVAAP